MHAVPHARSTTGRPQQWGWEERHSDLYECLLCRLLMLCFPCSDFRHRIVTALGLYLGASISQVCSNHPPLAHAHPHPHTYTHTSLVGWFKNEMPLIVPIHLQSTTSNPLPTASNLPIAEYCLPAVSVHLFLCSFTTRTGTC